MVKAIGEPVPLIESAEVIEFLIKRYFTPEVLPDKLIVALVFEQIVPPPETLNTVTVLIVNAPD